jgi:acyl-CoA synthetase (AMP-forming)/AMP-acid ligase II
MRWASAAAFAARSSRPTCAARRTSRRYSRSCTSEGLSTGDFKPALTTLLGEEASGLSATAITRMTEAWQGDYDAFRGRDLSDRDYVWANGIHFRIRLEEDRQCALVMIGVRPDGIKELIVVEDGYRESAESWASVLRDLARRARPLRPGEEDVGWLARSGHVPLGYLGDEAKTKRTYPVIDGVRYSVPGDRAQLAPDGTIRVFGRDSVCINSGGEKIFAEEVERALKHHPAVYDVVVAGGAAPALGRAGDRHRGAAAGGHGDRRRAARARRRRDRALQAPEGLLFVDQVVRTPMREARLPLGEALRRGKRSASERKQRAADGCGLARAAAEARR